MERKHEALSFVMDQEVSTKHVQKPVVILFLDLSGSLFIMLIND